MRTLLIDIETKPLSGYAFGLWDQNIGINQIITTPGVISFAAEWYERPYDKVFYSVHEHGLEAMALAAWKLLDEADAIITYNGNRFDIPWLNTLFIEAGVAKTDGFPTPYASIDLLQTVKRKLRLPSNKLEYVTKWLGIKTKIQTGGFELWSKCMAGDPAAWRKMEAYNRNDVTIMRGVYEAVLPLMTAHPNLNVIEGTEDLCPRCQSPKRIKAGTRPTLTRRYQRYKCSACHTYYSDNKPLDTTGTR